MAQVATTISALEQLLADAMLLPETERAELVHELLRSLSPQNDERTAQQASLVPDAELTIELQRRRKAYLDGTADWVSLEDLEAEFAPSPAQRG